MARNEIRSLVKLRSTAGTGYTYITRKKIGATTRTGWCCASTTR